MQDAILVVILAQTLLNVIFIWQIGKTRKESKSVGRIVAKLECNADGAITNINEFIKGMERLGDAMRAKRGERDEDDHQSVSC